MAKKYPSVSNFPVSFNVSIAKPLDSRDVVASLTELKNPATWTITEDSYTPGGANGFLVYRGLTVFVESENASYTYIAAGEVTETTIKADASWAKAARSSDLSSAQTALQTEVDKIEAAVGLGTDGSHTTTSGNYTSGATTVVGEIAALDTALKSANDTIAAEKKKFTDSATIVANGTTSYETAVKIVYVAGTSTVPAKIQLQDKNNKMLSEVSLADVIGNGVLDSSSYDKATGKLTLKFKNANGGTTDHVINLQDMLDINDVLIDSASTNYLGVTLTATSGDSDQNNATFSAKIVNPSAATSTSTGLADAYQVKTYVDNAIDALDVAEANATGKGTNVQVVLSETNGKIAAPKITETYATVTYAAGDNDPSLTVAATNNTGLVKGTDISSVKSYVDAKIAKEATGAIQALDSEKSGGTNVVVKVTQVDGLINKVEVSENYATVAANQSAASLLTVTNDTRIIKGSDLSTLGTSAKTYVDNLLTWVEIG